MQRQTPSTKHKFIADQMVGRLAKWLRVFGFDTSYFKSIGDSELLKIAKQEGRILLTRDTRLVERREIKNNKITAILIKNETLDKQLKQVKRTLSLNKSAFLSISRCAECNVKIEEVPKNQAQPFVPPHVFETHDDFKKCPKCNRHYWKGSHWEKISKKLDSFLE